MHPPSREQPDGMPRTRPRRHISQQRPKTLLLIALVVLLAVALVPASRFAYRFTRQGLNSIPKKAPPAAKSPDPALIAFLNRTVEQAGKNLHPQDLVLGMATLHERGGKVFLSGTIQNHSSRAYARVHLIFDTVDRRHNPSGVLEGDVSGVQPGQETPFELGPLSPEARSYLVRSIRPVE